MSLGLDLEFNDTNDWLVCGECGEEVGDNCYTDNWEYSVYCEFCFLQRIYEQHERCTAILIEQYEIENDII